MTDFETIDFSAIVCDAVDKADLNNLDDANINRLKNAFSECLSALGLVTEVLVNLEVSGNNIQVSLFYFDPKTKEHKVKTYLIEGEPI